MGPPTRAGNRSSSCSEDEQMEKIITKVCTNFVNQLEVKLNSTLEKFESKLGQIGDTLINLNKSVSENSKVIVELQDRVDYLEQQNKKNNLRFCGFEENDEENLREMIASFINGKLKVACEVQDFFFTSRVGKKCDKPRTIIVNFHSIIKRNEVLYAKKVLKGSPYAIYEDLTSQRYNLLALAKKKYGSNKAWSFNGNIFVWNATENKKVIVKSDL